MLKAAISAAVATMLALSAQPAMAAPPERDYPADRCSFASVSPDDQRQYRSRYNRRVRTEGREAAEAWLRSWLCPSAELAATRQEARQRGPTNSNGEPCRRTRMEMRSSSSGGSVTMIPVAVCAD